MKRYFLLCVLLFGCSSPQSQFPITTTVGAIQERDRFIESLTILDCAYNNQGCENWMGFTACVYKYKSEIIALSEDQKWTMENNLRTKFGFEKSSDTEINNTADMVLARYLQCKQ